MLKTCIIFNPTARGEKALKFRQRLEELTNSMVLKPTDRAGAAVSMATQAVEEGFETIVAAGGDGTVNEVVNGLRRASNAGLSARLGVLPLGTVNVFARELRLPMNPMEALKVIESGVTRTIDLVSVESSSLGGPSHRYFAQLAGAGLDSRAIERVDWSLKKRWGPLAYVIAGFHALRHSHPPIRVVSAERSAEGELVLLGNGRYYGGHFVLFPQATLEDGKMDVTVFPKAGIAALLRFGLGWISGNPHRFSGAAVWQSQRVTLSCEASTPFELDGDNVGILPATFTIVPQAIRVIVPASST